MNSDEYRMMSKIVRNLKLEKNKNGTLLNDNESEALRYITKHKSCISSDLVGYLNVDKALVTRIVKKLLDLDFIYIKEGIDKRKKYIYATAKAYEFKSDNENFELYYYQNLFRNIDEEEVKVFFKTLNKIYLNSKRYRKEGKI